MAASGLDETTQADWSGGICQAVARHLVPGDAAWDITDGLLDDDGDVYQRGPTVRATTSQASGTALAALFWSEFTAGQRLVGISQGGNTSVVNAAGTGWDLVAVPGGAPPAGGAGAQVGEVLFMSIGGLIRTYAGSRKSAPYSTGTVTVTAGSATVTGAGTSWTANADAGMILTAGAQTILGVVKSVDSNTQVTLVAPWTGVTAAGAAYSLASLGAVPGQTGTCVAAVGGRLLIGSGRKVVLSRAIDQNTGATQPYAFDVDDYHEFPAAVVGMAVLRDVAFVFTKAGIWSISNVALPIVDPFGNPQHRVQKISGDVVLRAAGGLAYWRDSLVIAAVGGIYTMDSAGGLDLISRSIAPVWQAHMKSGHVVGQVATFRDHAFVPIYSTFGVGNALDEVLVCRLDRRAKSPVGNSAPWTRFPGSFEAGWARAFVVSDPYGTPKLLAGLSTHGYLTDYTNMFRTALPFIAGGSFDANTAPFGMAIETREYVVDAGALATVRDVALEYESTDGQILVSIAVGTRLAPNADPNYTLLASTAVGNYQTQNPRVIAVRREARRVSFKLDGYGGIGLGATGWRLRAVRTRARLRGRRR